MLGTSGDDWEISEKHSLLEILQVYRAYKQLRVWEVTAIPANTDIRSMLPAGHMPSPPSAAGSNIATIFSGLIFIPHVST